MKPIALGIILAFWCVQSVSADVVYTLVSDSPQFDSSPYGFSGTITTDGSFGSFANADIITDWDITITTLAGVDGDVTEELNLTFDDVTFFLSGTGNLVATPTTLSISNSNRHRN